MERAAGVERQAIGGNAVVDRGTSSGGNGQDSSKEEWGGSRKGKWAAMQWEALSVFDGAAGGWSWWNWASLAAAAETDLGHIAPSAKTRPYSVSIILFKIVNRNIYCIKNGLYIYFRLILWP